MPHGAWSNDEPLIIILPAGASSTTDRIEIDGTNDQIRFYQGSTLVGLLTPGEYLLGSDLNNQATTSFIGMELVAGQAQFQMGVPQDGAQTFQPAFIYTGEYGAGSGYQGWITIQPPFPTGGGNNTAQLTLQSGNASGGEAQPPLSNGRPLLAADNYWISNSASPLVISVSTPTALTQPVITNFVKRYTYSEIFVTMTGSAYTNVAGGEPAFYVKVLGSVHGGTDQQFITQQLINVANAQQAVCGQRALGAGLPPDTYTISLLMGRAAGTGAVVVDANSWFTIRAEEVN